MEFAPIYNYAIWAVGLFFVVILTTALELGFRVGVKNREKWKDADSGGGAVVLNSMFALMGLVLAFTYAIGMNHYDANKKAVIIEANALGTAFLKANLVAEPGRTELKTALLDYARSRAFHSGAYGTNEDRKAALVITLDKQAELWLATMHVVDQGDRGPISSSLVGAINDVIDAHTLRLAALLDKLPRVVMWMLLLVAAASLGVAGYNAGIQGRMSRFRMTALTLVLTGLMFIILDFDRPGDGLVIVDEFSIDIVIADMEADLGQ
jgi:hypothetical protein